MQEKICRVTKPGISSGLLQSSAYFPRPCNPEALFSCNSPPAVSLEVWNLNSCGPEVVGHLGGQV